MKTLSKRQFKETIAQIKSLKRKIKALDDEPIFYEFSLNKERHDFFIEIANLCIDASYYYLVLSKKQSLISWWQISRSRTLATEAIGYIFAAYKIPRSKINADSVDVQKYIYMIESLGLYDIANMLLFSAHWKNEHKAILFTFVLKNEREENNIALIDMTSQRLREILHEREGEISKETKGKAEEELKKSDKIIMSEFIVV